MLQKAALGQQIEDVVAVDQRGHDQHRRRRARRGRNRAAASCPRATAPAARRLAAEGMAAIGFKPGKVALGAVRNLGRDRPFDCVSSERVDLGREVAQLACPRRSRAARRLQHGQGGARAQPQHRRAREMRRQRARRQATIRAAGFARPRRGHAAADFLRAPSRQRSSNSRNPGSSGRPSGPSDILPQAQVAAGQIFGIAHRTAIYASAPMTKARGAMMTSLLW